MIISASRRTDIPAFYSKWFINRIKDGFVMVRNPINPKQISKISLSPDVVDCIVFWTKNAKPIIEYLDILDKNYMYYFQYTLNAYLNDIESNVEPLEKRIDTIKQLSNKIGASRVIWRYDPILITEKYSIEWHIKQFEKLASSLQNHVKTCVFSFIDIYDKISSSMKKINARTLNQNEIDLIASEFSKIAKKYGLSLKTCSEEIDLSQYDISHSCCIDPVLISELLNCDLITKKDANQRLICGCVESIDIGQYNTCLNGCKYCYANYSYDSVIKNCSKHNIDSPLLIDVVNLEDKITERKMKSIKDFQIKLF